MAHHGGPHLPEDLVTHILERSGPLRGAYRVLSKAAAAHLRAHKTVSVARSDVPLWVVEECRRQLAAAASAAASTPAAAHAKLLAVRAAAGDLPAVVWLRDRGVPLTSQACIAAAERNQLRVLSWLLAQRGPACPLDGGACALAASAAGHLPILRFLQAEAVLRPFDLEACAEAAAAAGQRGVLEWLAAQDSARPRAAAAAAAAASESAAAAVRAQVQHIIRCARERGAAPLLSAARIPLCAA